VPKTHLTQLCSGEKIPLWNGPWASEPSFHIWQIRNFSQALPAVTEGMAPFNYDLGNTCYHRSFKICDIY